MSLSRCAPARHIFVEAVRDRERKRQREKERVRVCECMRMRVRVSVCVCVCVVPTSEWTNGLNYLHCDGAKLFNTGIDRVLRQKENTNKKKITAKEGK